MKSVVICRCWVLGSNWKLILISLEILMEININAFSLIPLTVLTSVVLLDCGTGHRYNVLNRHPHLQGGKWVYPISQFEILKMCLLQVSQILAKSHIFHWNVLCRSIKTHCFKMAPFKFVTLFCEVEVKAQCQFEIKNQKYFFWKCWKRIFWHFLFSIEKQTTQKDRSQRISF